MLHCEHRLGNPGGPGNPFARQLAALRQAAMAAITPDDVRAIIAKMAELALAMFKRPSWSWDTRSVGPRQRPIRIGWMCRSGIILRRRLP